MVALDADDLDGWLDETPAVRVWVSEQMGRRPRDVAKADGDGRVAADTLLWTRRGAIIGVAAIVVAIVIAVVTLLLTAGSASPQSGPVGVAVNTVPFDPIGGARIFPVPGGQPSDYLGAGQTLYIDCLQPVRPSSLLAGISDGPYKDHWIDVSDIKTPSGQDVRSLKPPLPTCAPPVNPPSSSTGTP